MLEKQIWEIEYIRDRCFEDNDTESEEEDRIEKAALKLSKKTPNAFVA